MSEREKYIAKTKGGKNTMSTKDAKFLKLIKGLKGAASDSDKLKAFKKIDDFFEDTKKDTESKIKGIPSDEDVNTIKRSLSSTVANTEKKFMKDGGLAEATAKLKAKGMKEGGMVVKDKTVAIDKSPNSGLITQRGFGASRRT